MVAYSPDGSRIATAEGRDGARVWDAALQGKPVPLGLPDGKLPDAKSIPAGFPLELRQLDTPLQVLQAPSRDTGVRVFWAEFSPDGKRLVTTHANGHVTVWNTSSWKLEADLALTHHEVRAATFSPDGNSLVAGDVEGELHRWDLASEAEGKTTRTTLGAVAGVTFSPDGKTLVTTHQSASGSGVMIWNTDTWTAVTRQGFGSAAFSQDGKMLALGGDGIELIDPRSQKEIRRIELPRMTLAKRSAGPKGSRMGTRRGRPMRCPRGRTAKSRCPSMRWRSRPMAARSPQDAKNMSPAR
jgi:WD40 repeat protein